MTLKELEYLYKEEIKKEKTHEEKWFEVWYSQWDDFRQVQHKEVRP